MWGLSVVGRMVVRVGYGSGILWVGGLLCRPWVRGYQVMCCDVVGDGGISGVGCVGQQGVVRYWWEWGDIYV